MNKNYELKMDKYQEEGKEKYSDEYIKVAHKHTFKNYEEVIQSSITTCMYCGYSFSPNDDSESFESISEKDGKKTVFCPNCYCDAIIGDKSGLPISDVFFIARCTREWFNGYSRLDYEGFSKERIKWTVIEVE